VDRRGEGCAVNQRRSLAWLLALVWFVWLGALQQSMAASARFGGATPDLVTVLLVSLAGAVRRRDLVLLALVAALARKSYSLEPAAAILTATIAFAGLAWLLRAFVDIQSPLWRAGLAALAAGGTTLWFELVRVARERAGELGPGLTELWPAAGTSALAALACGGLLAHLPGLSPLKARR
jgi:hypothetical protein